MRKFYLVTSLFLAGCAAYWEANDFEYLNQLNTMKDAAIHSCQQLRTESFDTFYAASNQQCLQNNRQKISNQLKSLDEAKTNKDKLSLTDSIIKDYKEFDKCMVTSKLTVKNVIPENIRSYDDSYNNHDISYLERAYSICENTQYFTPEEIKRIIKDYQEIMVFRYKLPDLSSLELSLIKLRNEVTFDEKINRLIKSADANPILRKLKHAAPDFMKTKLGDNNSCPLVLLIDSMSTKGANIYSDWADAENYKFIKKDTKTLVMSAGEIEMTFVKNGQNGANVTVLKNVNKLLENFTWEYIPPISKNTVANNFFVSFALCE